MQSDTINPEESTFASDIIVLTAEAPEVSMVVLDTYPMKTIDVQNLQKPFIFTVPLRETLNDTTNLMKWCMYFDEEASLWRKLECEGQRISVDTMQCCSYHMTQFAVHTVQISTYFSVAFSQSFIIPTIVILDTLLVVVAFAGLFFDRRKAL